MAGAVPHAAGAEPARQAAVHRRRRRSSPPARCGRSRIRSTPCPGCSATRTSPKRELHGDAPLARNFIATLLELLSQPTTQVRGADRRDAERRIAARGDAGLRRRRGVLQSGPRPVPRARAGAHQPQRRDEAAGQAHAAGRVRRRRRRDAGRRPVRRSATPTRCSGLKLEGTTGERHRSKRSSAATSGTVVANWPEQLQNIAKFGDSLAFLKDRSAGELGHAFRTTLDLYSHRLDAWITSLATKRLDEMREKRAAGPAHRRLRRGRRPVARLGAPGRPGGRQPRLRARAVAAAGGHGGDPAQRPCREPAGAPTARSTSTCARTASSARSGCSKALANGQSMAALLGYRFERALRDATLSQHILELRHAFPLRAGRRERRRRGAGRRSRRAT